jgi:hypothetical protein
MTVKSVEYKLERNGRMASYKGRYNCEILLNGSYAGDAQGDTASEAKRAAERKVAAWVRDGKISRG